MAIARSKVFILVSDILYGSEALTSEEAEELAEKVADKMVLTLSDVYDDSTDDRVVTAFVRDDV